VPFSDRAIELLATALSPSDTLHVRQQDAPRARVRRPLGDPPRSDPLSTHPPRALARGG
jgi:hypothetical protein